MEGDMTKAYVRGRDHMMRKEASKTEEEKDLFYYNGSLWRTNNSPNRTILIPSEGSTTNDLKNSQ